MPAPSKGQKYPDRAEIERTIADLIAGRITREEATRWADEVRLEGDRREITDEVAWDVLLTLCGADATTLDRPYLYMESDFYRWLNELRQEQSKQ